MKKLHKIGTSILLSLVPATTMGFVIGFFINNIDTEVEVTKEQWLDEFKTISETYLTSKYAFDPNDVTVSKNGVTYPVLFVNNYQRSSNSRGTSLDFNPHLDEVSAPVMDYVDINSPSYNNLVSEIEAQEAAGYKCYFASSKKHITINIPFENNHYKSYVINRYGFLDKKDFSLENWELPEYHYVMTYTNKPHKINTFDCKSITYWNQIGSSTFIPEDNTKYTFKLNIDDWVKDGYTTPLSSFSVAYGDTNYNLSILSIKGIDESSWYWNSENKKIIFNSPIASGSLEIACKINDTLNLSAYAKINK